MKRFTRPSIAAFLMLMSGCVDQARQQAVEINRQAEGSNSPFRQSFERDPVTGSTRWQQVMIVLPKEPSRASRAVRSRIMDGIRDRETKLQRPSPRLKEVLLLPNNREVWVLQHQEGIAYIIDLKGSSGYSIAGPESFVRNPAYSDLPYE